jgi:hypothetical protein
MSVGAPDAGIQRIKKTITESFIGGPPSTSDVSFSVIVFGARFRVALPTII